MEHFKYLFPAALLCLSACATTTTTKIICVPIKQYTSEQLTAISSAVGALPEDSPLISFIQDYHNQRQADEASCVK